MPITDAQFLAIVRTELDTVFYQTWNDTDETPFIATVNDGALFKEVKTTHAQYIGEVFKGTGLWKRTGEIAPVAVSNVDFDYKYTISVTDFTDSVDISKDFFDDNMHDAWANIAREFAMMARQTQNFNGFGLFRGATTTTLTADGVTFINTAHPLLSGGTQSNQVTGPLDRTSLKAALTLLQGMKNQAGVPVGAFTTSLILLVPLALAEYAHQLVQSVLIADSANNNTNSYIRSLMGIRVATSPYLGTEAGVGAGGSDTNCFLLSKRHSVSRLVRQGIQTSLRNWDFSDNRTYKYQGNFREEYFVPDYFGAVGIIS